MAPTSRPATPPDGGVFHAGPSIRPGILVLADGTEFEGELLGATPPGAVKRRIWIALGVGFAAAALFVALRLGFRPMDVLMHDRSFGMKAFRRPLTAAERAIAEGAASPAPRAIRWRGRPNSGALRSG